MAVECLDFRSCEKGSLRGFANFFISNYGIEIYGCTLYMKDGKRWVNLPSREYKDSATGESKYVSVVRFRNKKQHDTFSEAAKAAIDEWCKKKAQRKIKQEEIEELKNLVLEEESNILLEKVSLGFGDVSLDEFLKMEPDLSQDQACISSLIDVQERLAKIQRQKSDLFTEEIVIEELNKKQHDTFSEAAKAAIDEWCKKKAQEQDNNSMSSDLEEVPF